MADFLLECLLADATLLKEWGAHSEADQSAPTAPRASHNSRAVHHPPPPTAKARKQADSQEDEASAQEILNDIRRRKREYMQRSRQSQKHGIESMRATLEVLSLQFERLREQQQHKASDADASLTELPLMQLETAFGTLADTSHRLKAEKLQLKRLIMEREIAALRLADVVKSFTMAAMLKNEQRLVSPQQEPAAQYFEYTDFSPEQIQNAISRCYQHIEQHEQTARPLAHWVVGAKEAFDWTVNCDISTGSNFFLSASKRLTGMSPQEAMQTDWAVTSRPSGGNYLSSRRLARLAVLQTLNDSVCVVGEDVFHPIKTGVLMRTITVCFCLATERGFAIGTTTMNPKSPDLRRHAQPNVEYMDSFSWDEFARDDDGNGCVVSLKSLTQYNTNENLRLRLMNALCATRRWESEVMRNPIRLIAA